jgi:hypothetical protein
MESSDTVRAIKYLGGGLGLVFGALLVPVIGEAFLFLAYILIGFWAIAFLRPRWLAWSLASAAAVLIGLHCGGYKIAGRPELADIVRLTKPRRLLALLPPNQLVLSDGTTNTVDGIFFPRAIDLSRGETNQSSDFPDGGTLARLTGVARVHQPVAVDFVTGANGQGRFVTLSYNFGWCGNTFTPQFLPKKVSRTRREDLLPLLVRAGLALPTVEQVESQTNRSAGFLVGYVADALLYDLPTGHPEVIRLAEAFESRGELSLTADLLLAVHATNDLARLRDRLVRQLAAPSAAFPEAELEAVRRKVDADHLLELLSQNLATNEPPFFDASVLSWRMQRLGDLRGMDLLFALLQVAPVRTNEVCQAIAGLARELRFGGPRYALLASGFERDISPEFLEWYATIRPVLSWRWLPTGVSGFCLGEGAPFDAAYFASMNDYTERIRRRLYAQTSEL